MIKWWRYFSKKRVIGLGPSTARTQTFIGAFRNGNLAGTWPLAKLELLENGLRIKSTFRILRWCVPTWEVLYLDLDEIQLVGNILSFSKCIRLRSRTTKDWILFGTPGRAAVLDTLGANGVPIDRRVETYRFTDPAGRFPDSMRYLPPSRSQWRPARITRWAITGLVLTVLAFGTFTLALDRGNLELYFALEQHGVSTLATVTARDAGNHDEVSYAFRVDGVSYHGTDSNDGPNPQSLKTGDPLLIVYDSREPAQNCDCIPSQEISNDLVVDVFGGVVFGLLATALVYVTFGRVHILVHGARSNTPTVAAANSENIASISNPLATAGGPPLETMSPPGWYPDPARRFPQRYYDGRTWTSWVVDQYGSEIQDYQGTSGFPTP